MPSWLDHIVIVLAVIASAVYAIYALGPKTLRKQILKHVFKRDAAASVGGGCGGCGDCGTSDRPAETKIPVASLRKNLRS